MKLLAGVTEMSIYHGWSNRKTLWEKNFTLVNMENCGPLNVRKHREIKDGAKYINLDISLYFGTL